MSPNKPFLKWPGNKTRIIKLIQPYLQRTQRLVEPFVGSGAVFLNTNYPEYILCDSNPDLISLYKIVQKNHLLYINEAKKLFIPQNNNKETYYKIRDDFNSSQDKFLRSVFFLYLNRFGYNGLCRYNKSGLFNVPFGRHKHPYFPEKEIVFFAKKSEYANFFCLDYLDSLSQIRFGDFVYCDPPYIPSSKTASFTNYYKNKFTIKDHILLALSCSKLSHSNKIKFLVSNSNLPTTRALYRKGDLVFLEVQRNISSKSDSRVKANELLAVF